MASSPKVTAIRAGAVAGALLVGATSAFLPWNAPIGALVELTFNARSCADALDCLTTAYPEYVQVLVAFLAICGLLAVAGLALAVLGALRLRRRYRAPLGAGDATGQALDLPHLGMIAGGLFLVGPFLAFASALAGSL